MRVAIVHYWFLVSGGGERVIEALSLMYPQADIFALFADPATIPSSLQSHRIQTSFLDRSKRLRSLNRGLFLFYPLAIESLDVRNYDLIITSDSPPMKGVLTDPDQTHVCYCHTPGRFFWDYYEPFKSTLPFLAKPAFSIATEYLRRWDWAAAQNVDVFIANSNYVKGRIARFYERKSTVIYPPVNTAQGFISDTTYDAYLHVGRLVEGKRVDLLIKACNMLGRRLIVAGSGRNEQKLKSIAGPTIEFLGRVPDEDLPQLYAQARALLFAAEEDFGIVPLEAQAYGRPVIAYARGGSLETVCGLQSPIPTGLFFEEQTVESLSDGILRFEQVEHIFDPIQIRKRARTFDTSEFIKKMSTEVARAMNKSDHQDGKPL